MSNSFKTKKSSLKDGIVISINKQEDDVMKRFSIDIVWTDDTCLWIETKDGRRMCTPFSKWKRTKEPVPMIRYTLHSLYIHPT